VEGRRKCRRLEKVNKNHYPDPEWVWQQIELNEKPAVFYDKLEQKYSLNKSKGSGTWKSDKGYNLNKTQKQKKDDQM